MGCASSLTRSIDDTDVDAKTDATVACPVDVDVVVAVDASAMRSAVWQGCRPNKR